jgi:hypothetical protein
MISVSVSQVYNTSKTKTVGFLEEAYRRGKKVSSWLEFTEDDYNFLKNNFNGTAQVSEPEPVVVSEPEPVVVSEPEPVVVSEPEPVVV